MNEIRSHLPFSNIAENFSERLFHTRSVLVAIITVAVGVFLGASASWDALPLRIAVTIGFLCFFTIVWIIAAARLVILRAIVMLALVMAPILWELRIVEISLRGKMLIVNFPLLLSFFSFIGALLGNQRQKISGIGVSLIVWFIFQMIAFIISTEINNLWMIATRNAAIIVFSFLSVLPYFVMKQWGSLRIDRWIVWGIFLSAAVAAIAGLSSANPTSIGVARLNYGILNPNQLGQLMSFGVASVLFLDRENKAGYRAASFVFLVVFLICLVLTFSRESLLALVVILWLWRGQASRKRFTLTFTFQLILILVCITLAITFAISRAGTVAYSEGFTRIRSLMPGYIWETILNARLSHQWLPVLSLIRQNLLWGTTPYGLETLTKGNTSDFIIPIGNADNMFLGIFAVQGLFSFVAFIGFLTCAFSLLRKLYRFNGQDGRYPIVKLIYVVFVSYVISGLFAPHFMWPYNPLNMIVFSLIGVADNIRQRYRSDSRIHIMVQTMDGNRFQPFRNVGT